MKKFWYAITQWCDNNLTIAKYRLIKEAVLGQPYDHSYLLRLERAKLVEMRDYFMMMFQDFDHKKDIYWINICIRLIDIIVEQPENHPYVNTKNLWRFIRSTDYVKGVKKENVEQYYKSYPQDLRYIKAEHLYYEIRKEHTGDWWD